MTHLTSIVIPCYNQGKFLLEAVESAYAQTHSAIEVIVVNDGSTEDLQELETAIQARYPSSKFIHQENQGLSAARNTGAKAASGEFLLFLDADDKIAPTFVKKAVEVLMSQASVGFVTSYHQTFGTYVETLTYSQSGGLELYFLDNNNPVSCVLRHQIWKSLGGFDETMRSGFEDWEFWIRVTGAGWICEVIPEVLFFYRKHAHSMLYRADLEKAKIYTYIITKHRELFSRNIAAFAAASHRYISSLEKQKIESAAFAKRLTEFAKRLTETNLEQSRKLNKVTGHPLYKVFQFFKRLLAIKNKTP